MWFRPASMINYLKTGKDNYKDAQGTGLSNILTKMAKNGGSISRYLKSINQNENRWNN